jgi:hypothetical protein
MDKFMLEFLRRRYRIRVPNTSPFSGQTPQFFGNCQSNEAGVFLKGPESKRPLAKKITWT